MEVCELITDWAKLSALQDEWRRLWRSAGDAYFSQSFEWCAARWQAMQDEGGHNLACVVIRDQDRVKLIWPLVVKREAVWRVARPLDQVTTEYGAVLTEKAGEQARIAEAWRFARTSVRCDLFVLKAAPALSSLDNVLREAEPKAMLQVDQRRFVRFNGFADWDAYYRSVKNDRRRGLERRVRRLEEAGAVAIARAREPAERAAAIDWILATKADWLNERGHTAVWRKIRGYQQFLAALPADNGPDGGLSITLLKFDNKFIAGEIARVGDTHVEPFVAAFDPAFAKYSPGEILCRDCVKAAQDRGLVYDFRIGDDPYKSYWANGRDELRSYRIAKTPMGALHNFLNLVRYNWHGQTTMRRAPIAHADDDTPA